MASKRAGGGVFTTEELLGWLHGVKPAPRKDLAHVPSPGSVAHQMRMRAKAAEEEARRQEKARLQVEEEEESEEILEYKPNYNFTPDDSSVFDNVEDYDPGNLPNPNAEPGDYDYQVDQSVEVYDDFVFEDDKNPSLPIHKFKDEILDTITSRQVWRSKQERA